MDYQDALTEMVDDIGIAGVVAMLAEICESLETVEGEQAATTLGKAYHELSSRQDD